MTPKQLLEAHGGDPMAAVDNDRDECVLAIWESTGKKLQQSNVEATIAHLGEDGAEKWGQALMAVLKLDPFGDMWCEIRELRHEEITRIANATDRERLAACIVALAEVERDA